jgi:type IV pilus assembly protein PilA
LIELLIVVAMIGVMAALAVVGYRKYLNSAGTAEAKAVIQSIRGAQESYKAETLQYLSVSASSLTAWYPGSPDDKKRHWDNPGGLNYADWKTLNVTTDGPVRFGYAVVAGLAGGTVPATLITPAITWPARVEPWYVVQAAGDRDKDAKYAVFVSSSFSGEIFSQDETE